MAITALGEVGSASNKTSGTSLAVTNTSASIIPAGTLLLMVVAYDNHASTTAATVTASNTGGGVWTQRLAPVGSGVTTTAGSGIWDTTFSCRTVSDVAVGGTLTTLTFGNAVVAKLAVATGWRGVLETLRGTTTSAISGSGAPSVATGGTAPAVGDLVIGTASFETSATPGSDTDTLNGSWSTAVTEITAGGGGAATNIAQIVQWKIVTAGGHQTYNPTGANDSIASVRAFLAEPILADLSDGIGLTDSDAMEVSTDDRDNLNLTDSRALVISPDKQDVVALTDSVVAVRLVDLSDPVGLTDSVSIVRERSYTDIASMLRDGGGLNVMGIESSFETDTDVDGIADGWRAADATEFSVALPPDATALVPAIDAPHGHGSFSQSFTKTATGAKPALLVGPAIGITNIPSGNRFMTGSVSVYNPGAVAVSVAAGVYYYDGAGVRQGGGPSNTTVNPGVTTRIAGLIATSSSGVVARVVIGIAAASSGTVHFDKAAFHDGSQTLLSVSQWDYVEPANRLALSRPPIETDQQDPVGLTDSVEASLQFTALGQDSVGITDSVTVAKTIVKSYTDVASMLRDGGGNNLMGIESSFETDSNSDGIADGWRVPAGAELTFDVGCQPPDSTALVATMPSGHGSFAQRITRTTGSSHAILIGPPVKFDRGTAFFTYGVRVYNPTGAAVETIFGFFECDASDVFLGRSLVPAPISSGQNVDLYLAAVPFRTGLSHVRPYIGVSSAGTGTLDFDKFQIHDGYLSLVGLPAYDYVDPANRITFTPGGGLLTLDVQDSIGLADSVTTKNPYASILEYGFTEGSGTTVADTSGNGHTGTLVGTVAWDTGYNNTGVKQTTATHVDYSYVGTSRTGLEVTRDFTLMAWVKFGGGTSSGYQPIIEKPRTANSQSYALWTVFGGGAPAVQATTTDNTAGATCGAITPLTNDGLWHHICGTYDGSLLKIYVDGLQKAQTSLTGNIIYDTNDLGFGGSPAWSYEYTDGVIDEVRIYDVALDYTQINAAMGTPVGPAALAPVSAQNPVGITDSFSVETVLTRSDTEALTDSRALDITVARADTEALTDSRAITVGPDRQDVVPLTDSRVLDVAVSRTDTEALTDSRSLDITEAQTDTVGLTDSATVAVVYSATAQDLVPLTDSRTLEVAPDRSDPVNLTDSRAIDVAGARQDATALTDSFTVELFRSISATDQAGLTDAATLTADYVRDVSDSLELSDTAAISAGGNLDDQDVLGLSDRVELQANRTLSDVVGLTDSAVAGLAIAVNRQDTVALTDSRLTETAAAFSTSDQLALTDSWAITVAHAVTDNVALTDSHLIDVAGSTAVDTQDLLGVLDSRSISVTAVRSDPVQLADYLSSDLAATRSDTLTLVDSVTTQIISTVVGGQPRVFVGGEWQPAPTQVYDPGSASWQESTINTWGGSSWDPV